VLRADEAVGIGTLLLIAAAASPTLVFPEPT